MHEVTNTIGECFVEAKLLVVQTEVHSQRESFSVRYGKVGRVLFYPLRAKLYRRSPLAYGMIVSSFFERKLPRIIFSFHFPCSHQDSLWLDFSTLEKNPQLKPASWFLSDKRLFVRQGHNLLCSLEQRILINSDCHAVFTQKEVFSDQILFQHPLLRSITTCFSVSIRTSGDIWWHLMSPKPDLAASAILLQRDIKTVSCPVTGISPCRCSDSSCYRHSIMMLCQYVKRKKEDRIVSMGVSHDKLQKCRDPVKMIRYRQTAFLYFSGTALDRRGAGMFSEWHDSFTIWETIGTRHRRDLKRTGQQNDY